MPKGEKRSVEAEIIPPSEARREGKRGTTRARVFFDTRYTERAYVTKPGFLGIVLVIFVTGIFSTVLLVLVSAALLMAIPVVVFLVTAAITAGLVREYFWPQS